MTVPGGVSGPVTVTVNASAHAHSSGTASASTDFVSPLSAFAAGPEVDADGLGNLFFTIVVAVRMLFLRTGGSAI